MNDLTKMSRQGDCFVPLSLKLQHFIRWMHGTCIECPPQHIKADEVVTFNFYSDVSQNPLIIEQTVLISENIQKLLASINKCLDQWRRYDLLWKSDKGAALDRLAAEKPACVIFDEHLQFYMKVAQEVTQKPLIKDEQFIRLQLAPLASAVQENAKSWVMSLGKLLNELAREELFSLQEEIQVGVFSLGFFVIFITLTKNESGIIFAYVFCLTHYYKSAELLCLLILDMIFTFYRDYQRM